MTRRNPLDDIDPAVASILEDVERKQRIRRLPRDEQKKARQDAARERATYDMPGGLKSAIERVAREEGVSASTLAALLLADGIRRMAAGQISLQGTKRTSRCPRLEWVVDDETILAVLSGKISLSEGDSKLWR